MKGSRTPRATTWFVIAVALLMASPAFAYLGPGAGLGMIGSLMAVLIVVLLTLVGLVVYPIRLLRKRRSHTTATDGDSTMSD